MALARSTGRALAANVKTSNRPAVNVLGIVTNGNKLGFALVSVRSTGRALPASVNALHAGLRPGECQVHRPGATCSVKTSIMAGQRAANCHQQQQAGIRCGAGQH